MIPISNTTVDSLALGIPLGITELGPWALLILLVALNLMALFKGWIIPKIHYDYIVQRSESLQGTVDTLTSTNSVQARTIDKQTAVGDTVVRVMTSVQDAASKASESG